MTQTATTANAARGIHTAATVCLAAGLGGGVATIYLALGTAPTGAPHRRVDHHREQRDLFGRVLRDADPDR